MRRVSAGRSALRMTTSWMLVGLLAFGFPGATALASAPNPAPVAACALSVGSDPAGAAVYVNGELRGATPMNLARLQPGEHRVTVVKDGYLENSRVVTLRPGESGAVQVRMTPGTGKSRYTVQQEPGSGGGGGGGGKKALLIGLGVVAVGAGIYLALPKNKAPLPGTITANPSGPGLQGVTTFTFSSSATDPDGDPLTFAWNFGDNATGSGQSVTHVYANPGSFGVSLTVSDGKKTAVAPGINVTIGTLSGTWRGNIAGFPPPTVAAMTQSGASLSGTMTFPGFNIPAGSIRGTVTSPFSVTFTVTIPGFFPFTFNGTSDPAATRLTGTATGSGFIGQSWTLTKQ